jgi:glutathione S-transferase
MSDEIIFYTNPMSRGRIAHLMLEELGEPYKIELIRFDKGENKKPAFTAINPMGKLPTLVHKGTVVTEAAAICAYLADAFPKAGLAPALDDPARGTYFRWLFFAAGCVEPAALDFAFKRPLPDRPGVIGYGSYEDTLDALETALKPGPFILGEKYSAADVYVGSQIGWGLMTKSIEPRPVFLEYAGRLNARPASARVNEQCEALSKQIAAAS